MSLELITPILLPGSYRATGFEPNDVRSRLMIAAIELWSVLEIANETAQHLAEKHNLKSTTEINFIS